MTPDRGAIVVGWLAKLAVGLALVALIAFDGISVLAAHLSGTDDANMAAGAAATAWENTHNVQAAYNAAANAVAQKNETVLTRGFSVEPDGSVHLLLTKNATTLFMSHIGPLKKFTRVTEKGWAGPPP